MVKSVERHQFIIDYLRKYKHVNVSYLSETLKVSEVTIRKDLDKLEEDHILIRTHGGASLNESLVLEPSFLEKEDKRTAEKQAIATEAAKLVESGMKIAISTGTTVGYMPVLLRAKENLTVVTNAINIATQLVRDSNVNLFLTGGHTRNSTYAMVGEAAIRSLEDIYCEYAFIGTNGINIEHGITTPSMEEGVVVRKMIGSTKQTVVLADHSKFEQAAFYRVCPIEKIHILITDHLTPPEILQKIEDRGIRVIVASP